jgi:acetyl-CoA carboxylase biotin carboxylase subunit
MQIRVAMGEPLELKQEDIRLRGHAIECRIYAEDPENNFFPSPGLITQLLQPGGPGIREDCGVYAGWTVPLDYDPMLSKLVAFAATREMAIDRMLRALDEYTVGGIKTNIGLFRRILMDADFRAAHIDTGYLERLLAADTPQHQQTAPAEIAAIAAALLSSASREAAQPNKAEPMSKWAATGRLEGLRQ